MWRRGGRCKLVHLFTLWLWCMGTANRKGESDSRDGGSDGKVKVV